MLRESACEAVIRRAHVGRKSEDNLETQNNFVEVRRTEGGARVAKVRPRMNIVRHQFDVIAMNVVVRPAPDRLKVVVDDLSGIEAFISCHKLELLRNNEIATLDVVTFGAELREPGRYSRFVALAQILANEIEGSQMQRRVESVAFPFRRCRRGERAQ